MGRKTNIFITAGMIILLFVIFIIASKNDPNIAELAKTELATTLDARENSVVYVGRINNDVVNKLLEYKEAYAVSIYTSNIDVETFNELYADSEVSLEKPSYVLFLNNNPVTIVGDSKNDSALFEKYLYGVIPEEERYYKTIDKADEYIKKVNSKKLTVAVFGRKTCTYCNLYLKTINNVAKDNKLNIYYFDADTYNEKEYADILDLNFKIPAECTKANVETTMIKGFDKPLTIITKKGEMVGCLLGYVKEEELENKLKEVGVLK